MERGQASLEEIRRFYDEEYYAGDRTKVLPWHYRVVAGRLGLLRGTSVLDIACGTGEWLAYLATAGASVAGIDLSARAIERCREQLPAGHFEVGPAEELPFETGQFDLVTCMGSLEHFVDKPRAIAQMQRVARPGAQFLILVPNAGFLTRRLGLYLGTQQARVSEEVLTLEAWQALFENCGLRVVARWKDLHNMSLGWINQGPWWARPFRLAQALGLVAWPLAWQYQVYFLCETVNSKATREAT